MKSRIFTAEQVKFIQEGLNITLPINEGVELSLEMAEKIYDFAVDAEVDEIMTADAKNCDLSEYGITASSIVDLFSKKYTREKILEGLDDD